MRYNSESFQIKLVKTYEFQCPTIIPLQMKISLGIWKTYEGNCEQYDWKKTKKPRSHEIQLETKI